MSNFTRHMRQTATYWRKTGSDSYGKPTFASPVTMSCRWEDSNQLINDKSGREIVSKSRVFLANDISDEGYLYLGTSTSTSPLGVVGAHEIKVIGRQSDLRSVQTLHVAHL
jgi:hypothetical protein